MSPRRVQDVFKICLKDMLSRRLDKVFSITIFVFQDIFKTNCEMSSRHLCKMSSRSLGRWGMLRWRRVEDVFKACLEGVFKASWRPTNVCWVVVSRMCMICYNNCFFSQFNTFFVAVILWWTGCVVIIYSKLDAAR